MQKSDNKQKSMIHQLRKKLGIDDDLYREMLQATYRVNSSKDLTYKQAGHLLNDLTKKGEAAGVWQRRPKSFNKYKYNNMGYRDGMASAKQLRMIEAMWADYSVFKDPQEREEALRNFISKRFEVSDIKFIDVKTASKIIKTLQVMKKQKETTR